MKSEVEPGSYCLWAFVRLPLSRTGPARCPFDVEFIGKFGGFDFAEIPPDDRLFRSGLRGLNVVLPQAVLCQGGEPPPAPARAGAGVPAPSSRDWEVRR